MSPKQTGDGCKGNNILPLYKQAEKKIQNSLHRMSAQNGFMTICKEV